MFFVIPGCPVAENFVCEQGGNKVECFTALPVHVFNT